MGSAEKNDGFDTALARLLHDEGAVDLPTLQASLADVRRQRIDAPEITLARLLVNRRIVGADVVDRFLTRLAQDPTLLVKTLPGQPADSPRRFGPYAVERELARGGMGAVYEVSHTMTGARYALKTLLTVSDDEGSEELQRFRREAEVMAQLVHPHLARIHCAVLDEPIPYLVQDLLTGGTLQERIRREPLEVSAAVEITIKLAKGLGHAHDQGVLHRDLKPLNVIFDEHGEPQLIDFGLAYRSTHHSQRLTQTGAVMGTPSYMAPEQARGEATDPRTDVYGLGAVLYAMLTGEPPFRSSGSVLALLDRITREAPAPPSKVRPDLPSWLEAVCLRALAKAPVDRFTDMSALVTALESSLETPAARSSMRGVGGAALALGLALAAAALFFGTGREPNQAASVSPLDSAEAVAHVESNPLAEKIGALLAEGKADEALVVAEAALRVDSDVTLLRLRARCHILLDAPQAALVDLGRAARLGEGNSEVLRAECLAANAVDARLVLLRRMQYPPTGLKAATAGGLEPVEAVLEPATKALPMLGALGPGLARRLQETIARYLLLFGKRLLGIEPDKLEDLMDRARALAPGSVGAQELNLSLAWNYSQRFNHTAWADAQLQVMRDTGQTRIQRLLARRSEIDDQRLASLASALLFFESWQREGFRIALHPKGLKACQESVVLSQQVIDGLTTPAWASEPGQVLLTHNFAQLLQRAYEASNWASRKAACLAFVAGDRAAGIEQRSEALERANEVVRNKALRGTHPEHKALAHLLWGREGIEDARKAMKLAHPTYRAVVEAAADLIAGQPRECLAALDALIRTETLSPADDPGLIEIWTLSAQAHLLLGDRAGYQLAIARARSVPHYAPRLGCEWLRVDSVAARAEDPNLWWPGLELGD